MEDAATAEISRSQVWQWVHAGRFTKEHVLQVIDEEVAKLPPQERVEDARRIFEQVALADDFVEFLTLPAYELLDYRAMSRGQTPGHGRGDEGRAVKLRHDHAKGARWP